MNGFCNTSTTADTPSMEGLLATMRKFKQGVERSETFIATSEFGYFRKVKLSQILDWSEGRNMPSFLYDFGGWWLATSIRHALVTTTVYQVDWEYFERMSLGNFEIAWGTR